MTKFCCLLWVLLIPLGGGATPLDQSTGSACAQPSFHAALAAQKQAYALANDSASKSQAAGSLGALYLQMKQTTLAEKLLREALDSPRATTQKAQAAMDLGNLMAGQSRWTEAREQYDMAVVIAPTDTAIALSAELNRMRLKDRVPDWTRLPEWAEKLNQLADHAEAAKFAINLGVLAQASGPGGSSMAHRWLNQGRVWAEQVQDARLQMEALDQLAQLYEDQGQYQDALRLTDRAILISLSTVAPDLSIGLEWRRGRLLRRAGEVEQAILAYQRAVDHIEAIRQDIPIEYLDGRSSFRTTLEPVYLGLADLLLEKAGRVSPDAQSTLLIRARNTVELIKQTELADFLGERCSVDSAKSAAKTNPIAPHTAVLYPIILDDRVELLVETATGMERRVSRVDRQALQEQVLNLAGAMRANQSFRKLSGRLYDVLLKPVQQVLEASEIDTLVVVPDGVLRLLPFGVLHDGERFAIQKYAVVVAPGLSLTNTESRLQNGQPLNVLIAGVSDPGPSVEKLPAQLVKRLLFHYPKGEDANATESDQERSHRQLKTLLGLDGVEKEVHHLGDQMGGRTLLNKDFSLNAFGDSLRPGGYQFVHIASHGVFGATADATFVMAYDDLITIDRLQGLLAATDARHKPLELLTLSACETAEGDDRAPLGLSGAALKARVKSALGSLWPVADEAATVFMGEFYRNLSQAGVSKARAVQQAQLYLLEHKDFQRPFFWAPFVLVGGWL